MGEGKVWKGRVESMSKIVSKYNIYWHENLEEDLENTL